MQPSQLGMKESKEAAEEESSGRFSGLPETSEAEKRS
jgi:hypothetical protein